MNIPGLEGQGLPRDWPNLETLTRLANQLFSEPPGAAPPEATPLSASPDLPAVEHALTGDFDLTKPLEVPDSSQASLPGAAEWNGLPDLVPQSPGPVVTPGDGGFYFLEYAGAMPAAASSSSEVFDVEQIRRDFPILREQVNRHRLVWLDNAATTQKPQAVIDRLKYFYEH
jgi:cysteine desulfurase/selenocysteine lyase